MKELKRDVDIAMTVLLLLLMSYYYFTNLFHEVVGVIACVVFIIHNILNYRWYKSLAKGRYTPQRIIKTGINLGMMLSLIVVAVTGIMISKKLFLFIPLTDYVMEARMLHMAASRWLYIFISIHIGLHFSMMIKHISITSMPKVLKFLVLGVVLSVGAYTFIEYDFFRLMFLKNQYVFFDSSKAFLVFVLQYLVLMISVIVSTYYLQNRRGHKYEKK